MRHDETRWNVVGWERRWGKNVWCTDFNEDKHLGNTEGKSKIQMEDGGVTGRRKARKIIPLTPRQNSITNEMGAARRAEQNRPWRRISEREVWPEDAPIAKKCGEKTDRDGDVWSLEEARRSSKVAEVIKQAFSEVCPQRKVARLRLSPGGGFGIPMATRMRFQSSSSSDERKTH